jgi:TonB-dependent starch-binding outer membrane protein SusC
LDLGGIFLGRASSIFSPVASGYELKNGLASPKNLLAKTSNNLLHNVLSKRIHNVVKYVFITKLNSFRMKFSNTLSKGGILVALLVLLANFTFAQRTVKGKVTDAENGEGLIGATVTVVGTTRGAVTDIDGNYAVVVPEGSNQLRFAYTGYAEQVLTLGGSNTLDVAMAGGTALDEVVVVGYGNLKSREVTSSIASVKAEDFNRGNVTDPAQLIQGKVAGVTIARSGSDPNADFTIRLRGLSSISSGTAPLVVLDGVPGASLSLIDPNDIASIDVLKDGSAAAIYGTRASAGVILITTKKGTAGKTSAEYNGFVAFDQVARRYETLNADEFIANGGVDLSPNANVNTDWFDAITQTGRSNVHNLSLSGGAGTGSFRASFNVRDVEGILRNSGREQYNGSLSFTQKVLNNRLSLDGNLFMTSRNSNFGFQEAFRYAVVNNPSAAIQSTDAEFAKFGGYVEKDLFDYFNPVAMIEQNTNTGRSARILGTIRAGYEILPGLNAALSLSQERGNSTYGEWYSKQSRYRGRDRNGLAIRGSDQNVFNLLEFTTDYNINFGKNSLKLLGGYSWQEFENEGNRIEAGNILTNVLANNEIEAMQDLARGLARVSSYRNENRLIAFFGRAKFDFNEVLNVEAGLRREGSTRFGADNRWGMFPFASAALNLTKLFNVAGVDNLKLRGGYGVTGNQPNDNGLSQLLFVPGASFFYNGNYVPSYGPNRNSNPDLKWEEKRELNVGLDFALAGYKLTGSLDWYTRTTKDLILEFTVPVPPNLAPRTFQNVATISTTGIEAAINFNNLIDAANLKYSPSLVFNTFSMNLDEIGVPDTVAYANVGAPGQNDIFYTILYNNAPLGQLWGPVRESVNADGTLTYADLNGDGVVEKEAFNKDQKKIGNAVPRFDLGFNNSFTLGQFDLNFFLRGVFGHDLANEYRTFYENLDPTASTWNKVNTEYFDPAVKARNRFDNTHVERATFVKLDNATLGYNFRLPGSAWFTKARIYVSGQNLFTLTNYSGADPEARLSDIGSSDNGGRPERLLNPDPLALGIDRRTTYFLARTISFGVNFGF